MEKITTGEVAQAVSGSYHGAKDTPICSISTDTRDIPPGSLFIALQGENFDGHDFITQALEKGAVCALSHKSFVDNRVIQVKDTLLALQALAGFYRDKFDCPVVGITGSVGKTTTKEMTAAVLQSHFQTLKTQGNLNNQIGVPKTLFEIDSQIGAAVIEMGMSDLGEIGALSSITKPDIGIITCIGVSHMENLKSQENIFRAKMEITQGLKRGGILILNGDDRFLSAVSSGSSYKVQFFGIENRQADVWAEELKIENGNTSFIINYKGKKYQAAIPCVGRHNVSNALAAFTAGICTGIAPEQCCAALYNYVPAGQRQKISKAGNIIFIEDCYNASPDSMRAALSVLAQYSHSSGGRAMAVLADMLELGSISRQAHEDIGRVCGKIGVREIYCYGSESRFLYQAAQEQEISAHWFADKRLLAESVCSRAESGDVILFKASRGMKMEEVIEYCRRNLEKKK